MAKSVDPDQTASSAALWSGSALFVYDILSKTLVFKILGHLRYTYTTRQMHTLGQDETDVFSLSYYKKGSG